MNKKIIAGLLGIIIVIVGVIILNPKKDDSKPTGPNKPNKQEQIQEDEIDDIEEDGLLEEGEYTTSSPVIIPNKPNKKPGNNSSQIQTILFPYKLSDTLIIDSISSYDGIYIEDGSDQEISNVCALILRNTGEDIEYAEIIVTAMSRELKFTVSDIKANSIVVVQEASKQLFQQEGYTSVSISATDPAPLSLLTNQISITELEDGKLEVKNISNQNIPTLRLFYKFYLPDENIYIGGITYMSKVEQLNAGDITYIQPSHYNKGNSKIVQVRVYED